MKFRVWNIINVPGPANHFDVGSPKDGILLINKMANSQLNAIGIESNAFGLEYYDEDDNEWCEWYDEEGCGENEYEVKDGAVIRYDGLGFEEANPALTKIADA